MTKRRECDTHKKKNREGEKDKGYLCLGCY